MLTDDERARVESLFMHGAAALIESGMSPDQCAEFIRREDVTAAMDELGREYKDRDAHDARRVFLTKRSLSRLLPAAVSVLREALRGPSYVRVAGRVVVDSHNNPIMSDPPVHSAQMDAARDILNRMGVSIQAKDRVTMPDVNIQMLLSQSVNAATLGYAKDDVNEDQKALSRERRRTMVMRLLPKLEKAVKKADRCLAGKKPRARKTLPPK
jgi:hypothetical protein